MKMVPNPDGRNADFYRLAASGRLYLQQCTGCRQYYHPPRYLCRECGSGELEFVPSEGRGRVFSWTVTPRGVDPGGAEELPYATVVVEMEEGVRVVGALNGDPGALELDLPVTAEIDRVSEEFARIVFNLVG